MGRYVWQTLMLIVALAVACPSYADTLPTGGEAIHGAATFETSGDRLTIEQSSTRSVIQWDSFNIGQGAAVDFMQPDVTAATLNIVDGATSSILAGELTATGSVFLINPHGITVTPEGSVDTGGAFVASTLRAVDDAHFSNFMSGSNHFEFQTPVGETSGDIINHGSITAQDVLLLGSRVKNSGDIIVARTGRVALGSASQATLDLTGDGFLQVVLPSAVDGPEALVTIDGTIFAEGGLVQLLAATAYDAVREAVNMPGEIRARGVSGEKGTIIFHGGEGGTVVVSGEVDASQADAVSPGGYVELIGATIDADLSQVRAGVGGHIKLGANAISIATNLGSDPDTTHIVENGSDQSSIGDILRAGTHLTLHAKEDLDWSSGLVLTTDQISPDARDQAGHLQLLAGREIVLSGSFATYNSDWTFTANAAPLFGTGPESGSAGIGVFGADFLTNNNGHLTLEILGGSDSAGLEVWGIDTPEYYAGAAFMAVIAPESIGYDAADIMLRGDIEVTGDITLSGHLRSNAYSQMMATLSGETVTWTTEKSDRLAGRMLQFVEDGMVTRFGRGINSPSGPGVDAIRLELGSSSTVIHRVYGDADPTDPLAIGFVFNIAAHNKLSVGEGAPSFADLLVDGSLTVSGPGVGADVGDGYQLLLKPTADIDFHEMLKYGFNPENDDGNYWIDLTGGDSGATAPLEITPRPLTVNLSDLDYTYGSPQTAVTFDGLVNDDVIQPIGTISGMEAVWDADANGFRFGAYLDVGNYSYTVTGITGAKVGNYSVDWATLDHAELKISPSPLSYHVDFSLQQTYGTAIDVSGATYSLIGILEGDEVHGIIRTFDGSGDEVELYERSQAGAYTLRVAELTGDRAHNYVIADSGHNHGQVKISRREVTWSVADATGRYGVDPVPGAVSLDGVLDGDIVGSQVQITDILNFPVTGLTGVGIYTQRVTALVGADSANYKIAGSGHTEGKFTVNPAKLTYDGSPHDYSVVYGNGLQTHLYLPSVPDLKGIVQLDDNVGIDTSSGWVYQVIQLTGSTKTFSSEAVGTYAVVVNPDATLIGIDSRNYVLDHENSVPTIVTVTPLPLNYSVGSLSTEYGSSMVMPSFELRGVLGDDDVFIGGNVRVLKDGHPVDVDGRIPAGQYVLDLFDQDLKGEAAGNYTLSPSGSPGSLHITPKEITWSHGTSSNVYGDPLKISDYTLHGVFDDDDVVPTWEVVGGVAGNPLQVGLTYSPLLTGLTGLDAGNYTYSGNGINEDFGIGTLRITPRPLQFWIDNAVGTYGETGSYGSEFPIGDISLYNLLAQDEAPKLSLSIYDDSGNLMNPPGQQGFSRYYTPAGSYQIYITGLDDPNYMIDPEYANVFGSTIITPRELTYSISLPFEITPFLTMHTSNLPEATVSLTGVLDGDEVALSAAAPDMPVVRTEGPAAGFYQVGTYTWTRGFNPLEGKDAGNYFVASSGNQDATLTIRPYLLEPVVDVTAVYGSFPEINVSFAPYHTEPIIDSFDDIIKAFNFELSPLIVDHGSNSDLWLPVGTYQMKLQDGVPPLVGVDAIHFDAPTFRNVSFYVEPMPVSADMISGTRIYGDADLNDLFSIVSVDGNLLIDDADVTVSYTTPQGFTYLDPRNPVGTYTGFSIVSLAGSGSGNYTLTNPGPVSAVVTIVPRTLLPWPDQALLNRSFGEYFDLTPELDYIAEGDEELVWGEAMVEQDGHIQSARNLLRPGAYTYFIELAGPAADNYVLGSHNQWLAVLTQKELVYWVEDVIGQYGNFLACLDLSECYDDLWKPGLSTGKVHFDGFVPGYEDVTGVVGLIDFNGRSGQLSDVPPPGDYFQVVNGLEGSHADYYVIAESGSAPGLLHITPQWVKWSTPDTLYMNETMFLATTPDGMVRTRRPEAFLEEYQPVEHPLYGPPILVPSIYYIDRHGRAWTQFSRRRVDIYEMAISHFEGFQANYYLPVPSDFAKLGTLSVLIGEHLGMDFVDRSQIFDNPVPTVTELTEKGRDVYGQPWWKAEMDARGIRDDVLCRGFGACTTVGAPTHQELPQSSQVTDHGVSSGVSDYAKALAKVGIRGVELELTAEQQVNIKFEYGPGFVNLGAQASAELSARLGLTEGELSAKIEAGVYAETGVKGYIADGLDGQASLNTRVQLTAQASSSYAFKDGKMVITNNYMASAGASAGFKGELSTDIGSVRGGSTLHSPGAVGGSLGGGVGYSDGVLSVDLNFGIALGFFGVEFDLGFDLDISVVPGAAEAIQILSEFGLEFARAWTEVGEYIICGFGIKCPSNEPSRAEAAHASDQAALMVAYPAERYRYLSQTSDWRFADPNSASYRANLEFYETFSQLRAEMDSFREQQQAVQAELFRLMEEDPVAVIEYAQWIAGEYMTMDVNYRGEPISEYHQTLDWLQRRLNSLGVGIEISSQGHALYRTQPSWTASHL